MDASRIISRPPSSFGRREAEQERLERSALLQQAAGRPKDDVTRAPAQRPASARPASSRPPSARPSSARPLSKQESLPQRTTAWADEKEPVREQLPDDAALRQSRRLAAREAQMALGPVPDVDDLGSEDTDSTFTVDCEPGPTSYLPGTETTTHLSDFADPSLAALVGGRADSAKPPKGMTSILLGGGRGGPYESASQAALNEAIHAAELARARTTTDPRELARARKAALQQVGSTVHANGMPFRGAPTSSQYGAVPIDRHSTGHASENPKTKAQRSHNVTGATTVPIAGAFETESRRQARLVRELAEATGGWGTTGGKTRPRDVQRSSLADALKASGRFTGIGETARTFGRGGLTGSLGDGTRQASRHRPPSSNLFAGGGGFRCRTETADASLGPVMGDLGLNVVGSKMPTEHKELPRGHVAPLYEGTMHARRVALHADSGIHKGRPSIRTPGQVIETNIRRDDRVTRRAGGTGLDLGASLTLARQALLEQPK
jgi:hypothetical protein